MGRAIFKPIPVDEGFCIVLQTLLNEPYSHERNCEKRGRRPTYVELFDLFHLTKAIESDSSLSWFMPLPEKMDHDTWMELIQRMTDAWETYCLHCQTLLVEYMHLGSASANHSYLGKNEINAQSSYTRIRKNSGESCKGHATCIQMQWLLCRVCSCTMLWSYK